LDFIARLAALRAAVTPGRRGAGARQRAAPAASSASKAVRMNWARRLRRVFGIEIEQCAGCGGRLRVIASIEEPGLIERILAHRRERGEGVAVDLARSARLFEQACEAGNAFDCLTAGSVYEALSDASSRALAVAAYRKAAELDRDGGASSAAREALTRLGAN
jgi:hypothetical protein